MVIQQERLRYRAALVLRANRRRLRVLLTLTLGAGCFVVVDGGAAFASGATITLYNGQHVQTTDALVSAFEKKTGISVSVRSETEDTFTDQIIAEGSNSPADVFYTENSPPLEELQGKDLLAPVDRSTISHTVARYDSPKGDWVGVSARVSVMIYNTRLVRRAQLPTSVLGLAKPEWRGKLALAPGETDFQPIVTSVARADGKGAALRWLDGLRTNAGNNIFSDNETVTSEVNAGQVAIGVIDQYYWYRLRAQVGKAGIHSAIAYFTPHDPGYVVDVSGAGVLRSSTHQAAAQRLVAFLASAQAQKIIARSDSFEYPLDSGVTTAQSETPFADLEPRAISVADLGTGAEALALLQEAQLL